MTTFEQLSDTIYVWKNGAEIDLEECIAKIFGKNHIPQFSIDFVNAFDSPGHSVEVLCLSWFENGKLETLNELID